MTLPNCLLRERNVDVTNQDQHDSTLLVLQEGSRMSTLGQGPKGPRALLCITIFDTSSGQSADFLFSRSGFVLGKWRPMAPRQSTYISLMLHHALLHAPCYACLALEEKWTKWQVSKWTRGFATDFCKAKPSGSLEPVEPWGSFPLKTGVLRTLCRLG